MFNTAREGSQILSLWGIDYRLSTFLGDPDSISGDALDGEKGETCFSKEEESTHICNGPNLVNTAPDLGRTPPSAYFLE